jgi:hypothetical protein
VQIDTFSVGLPVCENQQRHKFGIGNITLGQVKFNAGSAPREFLLHQYMKPLNTPRFDEVARQTPHTQGRPDTCDFGPRRPHSIAGLTQPHGLSPLGITPRGVPPNSPYRMRRQGQEKYLRQCVAV